MFPSADFFRLDWRPEFKKLAPFLKGEHGIVRIDFASDDAAPEKFNHILKEDFAKSGNKSWLSLRIDHDWSTTYTIDDQILAFEKKLAEGGIVSTRPQSGDDNTQYFSGNSPQGNLGITVSDSTFISGFDTSSYGVDARIGAVCESMRRYVACGGHFMVIINDMLKKDQGLFWNKFWNSGLREAGGDNLLLVYFVGPLCGAEEHPDAPIPTIRFSLPTAFEGDENRENDVYDDIIDLFTKAGYDTKEAAMAFDAIIAGHGHSVRAVQMGLAKLVMRKTLQSNGSST